jgi:aspartate aminotransferase-like enzyme
VQAQEIKAPWGTDIPPAELAAFLETHPDSRAVFCTLSETSTGTVYDVEGFARLTAATQTLLVVDGISGLGAMPCPMDRWGVDVLISGSQKSFMTPPGLAFIAFSGKAWESVEASRLPRFYFDAQAARNALGKRTSAWTPAISLVRQLREALKILRSIGLQGLFAHHRALADAARAGVRALGLELLSQRPGNILTAVKTPSGLDGSRLVKIMQTRFKTHIAGAQDPHQGEFFRIGHLGFIGGFDIITALSALEMTLGELGYTNFERGGALKAAQAIIKENWQ